MNAARLSDTYCDICLFLESMGGAYAQGLNGRHLEGIVYALVAGQFVWKKGEYFCGWWHATSETIETIKRHTAPHDVTHGDILYITECAIKTNGKEMVRKMKRRLHDKYTTIAWYRSGKGWTSHRRVKP